MSTVTLSPPTCPLSCHSLPSTRKARPQHRRTVGSRNPVKKLAARQDLQEKYTEVRTNVAEKELRRIKREQSTSLGWSGHSTYCTIVLFPAVIYIQCAISDILLWLPGQMGVIMMNVIKVNVLNFDIVLQCPIDMRDCVDNTSEERQYWYDLMGLQYNFCNFLM